MSIALEVCSVLNYFEHFLLFCLLSVTPFAALVGVPVVITSSALGIKISAITTGIKKYKLITKKKEKARSCSFISEKLNTIKKLISNVLRYYATFNF